MLSIAFIMAFVIAAVSLIIGILVFSEITESMAETIPEILVEIPTTPEVEGLWIGREHCDIVGCDTTVPGVENRMEFIQGSGYVEIRGSLASQIHTHGHLMKVFDRDEIDGKLITVELSLNTIWSSPITAKVYDGVLDPNPTGACGVDCFPDEASIVTSGSGLKQTIFTTGHELAEGQSIQFKSGTVNLSTFDSPTDKVTVTIEQTEHRTGNSVKSRYYSIDIADHGTYLFKSDLPDWSGTAVTCLRECNVSQNNPDSLYEATSLPPPPLPVFNSQDTLNANAAFNRTINIGWTVISIIPITLFFALFTLFSPRIDGEIF